MLPVSPRMIVELGDSLTISFFGEGGPDDAAVLVSREVAIH